MINQNNLIEKSRNVAEMCLNELNDMQETDLRILNVYLSRINARDKSTRKVVFSKKEYEELLGVTKLDTFKLNEYIKKRLQRNSVTIFVPNENGKINMLNKVLFPDADLIWSNEFNEYQIVLSINQSLDNVFFDIKNLGYIKYRLHNIMKLKSRYDIKLYLLMKMYEYKEPYTFTMPFLNLKKKLDCVGQTYDSYTMFNARILKQSIKRINDFTDITISYRKPRKRNHEEEIIEFIVKPKLEVKEVEEIESLPEPEPSAIYRLPSVVVEDAEQEDIDILLGLIKEVHPNADIEKINSIFKRVNINCTFPKDVKSPYKYYRTILKAVLSKELDNQEPTDTINIHKTKFHNQQENERKDIDLDALLNLKSAKK